MDGDRLVYGAENGLSRRAALTTVALGSTFALAVQPVSAADHDHDPCRRADGR